MSKLVRFTWICTKMGDSQARELIHNLICLLKVKMNLSSQELYYTKPQLSSFDCLFQITIIIIYDILSLYKYVLSAYHVPEIQSLKHCTAIEWKMHRVRRWGGGCSISFPPFWISTLAKDLFTNRFIANCQIHWIIRKIIIFLYHDDFMYVNNLMFSR